MAATVEAVGFALVAIQALRVHRVDGRGQRRGTVHHRGIDDLSLARCPGLPECAHHAECENQSPAPKIANQIEGHDGWSVSVADGVQHT